MCASNIKTIRICKLLKASLTSFPVGINRLIWEKLPAETDILITHGPPVGYGDLLSTGRRAGDVDLLYHVQKCVSHAPLWLCPSLTQPSSQVLAMEHMSDCLNLLCSLHSKRPAIFQPHHVEGTCLSLAPPSLPSLPTHPKQPVPNIACHGHLDMRYQYEPHEPPTRLFSVAQLTPPFFCSPTAACDHCTTYLGISTRHTASGQTAPQPTSTHRHAPSDISLTTTQSFSTFRATGTLPNQWMWIGARARLCARR